MRRGKTVDLREVLGEAATDALALLPPRARAAFDRLGSGSAAERLTGIGALFEALSPDGVADEDLASLIAPAVDLACSPRYPGAAALLFRLAALCASVDEPPRTLASTGAEASQRGRLIFDAIESRRGALLGVVRRSSDPEAARIAARLCARFPSADAALEPLLVALLGGASNPEARAPLLYALARVGASRDGPLHRRVAEALADDAPPAEHLAVTLALIEHDPPEPARSRCVATLRDATVSSEHLADPTGFGRALTKNRLQSAIERSERR